VDLLEGELSTKKKFLYSIRIWKDVEVSANDLDEAFDRAKLEKLDEMNLDVISMVRTGIPECDLNRNDIHSNN
jgi:hypothetical protein